MNAHHRIDPGIIQHPFLDHGKRSGHLLVGLENEFDGTRQGMPVLRQHPGGHQQHGHVGVMPASVHHAGILRFVGHLVLFDDRQGVHVRPQHQHRTRPGSLEAGHHSGSGHSAGRQPQILQVGLDHPGRAVFFEAQFRVLVKITPQGDQFILQLCDLFGNCFLHH